MVEERYVKKRKRKKLAAFITVISTIGVSTLILASFLGYYSGSFTVSLNSGNVKLSLSTKQNFGDGEGTGEVGEVGSYLKISELKPFDQMTYLSLPDDESLDNQDTTYLLGENTSRTMNFFKYTFFVKNIGSITADYKLTVKITSSIPSVDGRHLDPMLRVMFYSNDGRDANSHERTVYAAASETQNYGEDGTPTFNEFISLSPAQAKKANVEFPGFATSFESENVVTSFPVRNFSQGDMKRYTLVTWIEGFDPQGYGDEAPEGACVKLGVEINAYENE